MKPTIVWAGEVPGDIRELEQKIIDSLMADEYLRAVDDLSTIMFHHVFLSGELDGPCVVITGGGKLNEIVCTYHETMTWDEGDTISDEQVGTFKEQGMPVKEGMKWAFPGWLKKSRN